MAKENAQQAEAELVLSFMSGRDKGTGVRLNGDPEPISAGNPSRRRAEGEGAACSRCDSDDDLAARPTALDVAQRSGGLTQRVGRIDDRPEVALLDERS